VREYVKLHAKLKSVIHKYNSSNQLYEYYIKKAIDLEDIEKSFATGWGSIEYSRKTFKICPLIARPLDWLLNVIHPVVWTTMAIFCAILSISLVWSVSIFFALPTFSIYGQLVSIAGTTLWVQIISFIGISYIGACVYAGLFNFRLFNYYRLLKRNTDANSIIFSAAYLSRLNAPLALNFLHIINLVDSAKFKIKSPFLEVIGSMSVVPILGDKFQIYFPLCILIFFALAIFNVGYLVNRCIACCRRIKKLQFTSSFDENKEKINQGKQIVSDSKKKNQLTTKKTPT